MSLRPQNQCNACSYTWFPRGKHLSLRCPGCGSRDIETVRPPVRSSSGCGPVVLVAILIVLAIGWAASRSGGGMSSPSPASEPAAASAGDASSAAQQQLPASEVAGAAVPQGITSASDTASASVSASDESVSNTNTASASEVASTTSSTASPRKTYVTSFDCAKAEQEDEIAICGDPGLAAMDVELADRYQSAMKTVSEPKALAQTESGWVIARHMCDGDLDCLRRAYGERIGQFKGALGSAPLLSTDSPAEQP
jgi:uncharacterized protein YecT (DUF1311 family)